MGNFKLKITTTSPVINYDAKSASLFAFRKKKIYFINMQKLEEILAFLNLKKDFNNFLFENKTQNISAWLKSKKLFSERFLEEVSISYINAFGCKNISSIRGFGLNCSEELSKYLTDNFKNILMFAYLNSNMQRINDYVKNLLIFFKKKSNLFPEEKSFHFFVNCLFEVEKEKLFNFFSKFRNFILNVNTDKNFSDCLYIQKIFENILEFHYISIKSDTEINFNIQCEDEDILEKIMSISQKSADLKFEEEVRFLKLNFPKKMQINKPDEKIINNFNVNFLNINQLLYLNLFEENKLLMKDFFNYPIEKLLFPVAKNTNQTLQLLNYAKIEIKN